MLAFFLMRFPLTFQFTHPGRGATSLVLLSVLWVLSFNSRTPGGVRLEYLNLSKKLNIGFNSRTPGGVRLVFAFSSYSLEHSFNSRTPGGVRPTGAIRLVYVYLVSIHAPREGCDYTLHSKSTQRK